jgi:murein L,D-transpeptidase YafK
VGGTLPSTLVDPRLLAEKARRTLTVFSEERPVKTYRIALGSASGGDKVREGDGRTPEGVFYLCSKNEQSAYHLSLGLSYPNVEDAERGRRDGLINPREYRAITDALKHYRRPPWNTRLGGEIMIHGGGTASDWTTGCIAVDDADIDELFGILPLGTEVEIRP